MCGKIGCIFQKQVTFTANQFLMEGYGFENTKKKSKIQKAWVKFLKPTVNTLAPVVFMTIGAKTKTPQATQATTFLNHEAKRKFCK